MGDSKKNIISVSEEGIPILENHIGCKLIFHKEGNFFGLGSFYIDGKKLGDTIPYFVFDENVNKAYKAFEYEIIENSPERGVIRFSGVDEKLKFYVTITLLNKSTGFKIDYEFYPIHPIYHPLFINIPFKSSAMQFVKYPYEETIRPGFTRRWSISTDRGRAPFIFGSENIDGEIYYIGLGYQLTEDYIKGNFEGRLEFDPITYPNAALKIYTPYLGMASPLDLQCVTRLELLRHINLEEETKKARKTFNIIVSIARNQYDCIKGYIDQSGYDLSISTFRSIDDAVTALISVYKNVPGYIKGKGYPQLIKFNTGDYDTTVPHGWYSKYILIGPQVQLAYQLYKYWETHPEESWARDRAIEMANFLVKMQENNGGFSTWDIDTEGISVIHPYNIEGTPFEEYRYCVEDMSMGALFLYKLYSEVKSFEHIDHQEWKNAAIKTMEYIVNLMGPDGELGRNYNQKGGYDKLTSGLGMVLLALDYIGRGSKNKNFEVARDKLENWLYNKFIKLNDWCNASVDAGAWQGAGWPPPHNNDCMGTLTFATYCVYRYMETKEERYLQLAKDVIAYQWLTTIPIQYPGYKHITKGLWREQDFYSCFDVPFRGNEIIDCLPFLSKVTGDPFFMKYYRMLIQTQLHYQAIDKPYPAFYIGLKNDNTGREPVDELAEENVAYIIRFAAVFLESVNSPYAYRYVRGIGLDYDPPCRDLGPNAPNVISASTMVREISWDSKAKILFIILYDRNKRAGTLDIEWRPDLYPISEAKVEIDGKIINASEFYDSNENILSISYKHDRPMKTIRIYCQSFSRSKK